MNLDAKRKLYHRWVVVRVPILQAERQLNKKQSRQIAQQEWLEIRRQQQRAERGLEPNEPRYPLSLSPLSLEREWVKLVETG
jgi:hypothetical protein